MSHKMRNRAYADQYASIIKRLFKSVNITGYLCETLDSLVEKTVKSRNGGKFSRFDVSSWINRNYDPHEQVIWLLKSGVSENDIRYCLKEAVEYEDRAEAILKNIEITDEVRLAMQDMVSNELRLLVTKQSCKENRDLDILLTLAGEETSEIIKKEPGEQVQWLLQNGYGDRGLGHILSNAHEWLLKKGFSPADIRFMALAFRDVPDPDNPFIAKTEDLPEPA